jgi:hypothetical protein
MRKAPFIIVALSVFCSRDTDRDDSSQVSRSALTAADYGLDLMLPFRAGDTRVVTRGYLTPQSHLDHGYPGGLMDDRYAVDFAGPGCSSWNAPVLAAATGIVVLESGTHGVLDHDYGAAQVFIDHGNGCRTHYAHLNSRNVVHGQRVVQGQVIGTEGNLGSTGGVACPEHPGTHLHFKLVCNGQAVRPEPMSGHVGLEAKVGQTLGHTVVHHPVGTVVQVKARADSVERAKIYLVCGPDTLCWIRDERAFYAHRLYQDSSNPWALVAGITEDEFRCHRAGQDIVADVTMKAVRCRDGTYLTLDENGRRSKRIVPHDPSIAAYRITLQSWGFKLSEIVDGGAECGYPPAEPLVLRDGAVIEQSSDDDFFVVMDGYAYRLYRNLMPALYGGSYARVIQVPDGSVPVLVKGVRQGDSEFTVGKAATCPLGGSVGGGSQDPLPMPAPPPPVAEPSAPPVPAPSSQPIEPHVIHCENEASGVKLTVRGPFQDALVNGQVVNPSYFQYGYNFPNGGSDWNVPYPNGTKAQALWPGDDGTFVLVIPPYERFNLFLKGDNVGRWFDLAKWKVTGECAVRSDGSGGLAIFPAASTPVPEPVPAPAPPSPTGGTLACSDTAMTVTGPILERLVNGPIPDPVAIRCWSDSHGWDIAAPPVETPWSDDTGAVLTLPLGFDGWNCAVISSNGSLHWFDLIDADGDGRKWSSQGCRIAGTKLYRK